MKHRRQAKAGVPVLLTVLWAACCPSAGYQEAWHAELVQNWLLCIECYDRELESVLALRQKAVSILTLALRGPAPEDSVSAASRFTSEYVALRRWTRGHPDKARPLPDSARFVRSYLVTLYEGYQARAARALDSLDELGVPAARDSLAGFWNRDSLRLRPQARRLVDSLLQAR